MTESEQPERDTAAVSVVVPTYREAENLPELAVRIQKALQGAGLSYEFIIVDDDSRDGTREVCADLAAEGHPLRLIVRTDERGLSSAVLRGFHEAAGDTLLCMDADLSHPPEAIPRMLECLRQKDADFVIGSRYVPGGSTQEGWGAFRWVNSKVATLLARPFTSARDPMAGFFALPREVFERAAPLNPVGYKIGLELMVKCGCEHVCEVPITFSNRKRGESKLSLGEQVNYVKHLKRLADFKFGKLSRFLQFCAVGGTGAVVNVAVFMLLLSLLGLRESQGWDVRACYAGAIYVAMTWNFVLNRWITFSAGGSGDLLGQYGRFLASCSVGAVVNWSVFTIALKIVPAFAWDKVACAALGILAGLVFNYALSHAWVFRSTVPDQGPAA